MYVTSNGSKVSILTDNGDGTITVRLHDRSEVLLREPTAREYAVLRTRMREADKVIEGKYPEPEEPFFAADDDTVEAQRAVADYRKALTEYVRDRIEFIRDPDEGPYLMAFLDAVNTLTDGARTITADDVNAEAFKITTCMALLEVWEAPLDGAAVAPSSPAATAVPAEIPDAASPPASPESEESSPPGTEPASPSLPPS